MKTNSRVSGRRTSVAIVIATLAFLGSGCQNPQITDRFVSTTPETYSETRVFFLGTPEGAREWRTGKSTEPDVRRLLASFEVARAEKVGSGQASAGALASAQPQDGSPQPNSGQPVRPPTQPSQSVGGANLPRSQPEAGAGGNVQMNSPASQMADQKYAPRVEQKVDNAKTEGSRVRHNDPLSIIVNKVVMPPYSGTKDIAVVLDILTRGDQRVQPLVVWYQRNVPGGKELSFENLLVYFDNAWDSRVPAHFRIRLISVEAERNEATLELLNGVKTLAAGFQGMVPHPVMPGVDLGIEAARQILSHRVNTLLMDYTVELYAATIEGESGGADLGYLRTGQFIAMGLRRDTDAEIWRQQHYFDQRTLRVYSEEDLDQLVKLEHEPATHTDGAEPLPAPVRTVVHYSPMKRPRFDAPIVLMTVATAEAVVPTIVQDRSEELTKLLSQPPTKLDLDALESNIKSLESSVKVFVAKRRLDREQNREAMEDVIELLKKHQEATNPLRALLPGTGDAQTHILSSVDLSQLMLTLERQTGLKDFSGVDDWLKWWLDKGGKGGAFKFQQGLQRKLWVTPKEESASDPKNATPQNGPSS